MLKNKKNLVLNNSFTEFLLYTTSEGKVKVEIFLRDENIWLTQAKIAALFGVERSVVTKHLQNLYQEGEINKTSTCAKIAQVQSEGERQVTRNVEFYNLDAILSVGYRVNSRQATLFRIWATERLKEYIIKGFTMNDERLKNPNYIFGKDYFDELMERIREIRSSERRFYQKIADIYALSADYDKNALETKDFYAEVQNKLHWAITGKTAAEIIYSSADAQKAYMGLTTWKNAPGGKILKSDIVIAKNYLNKAHIDELNRIISAYLDLAENRAKRQQLTKMSEWKGFLERFLKLSDYPILNDKGKVTMLEAKLKAESEYDVYRLKQDKDYISDFDYEIKRLEGNKKRT